MGSRRLNAWAALPESVRTVLKRQVLLRDGGVCQLRGPGCTVVATEPDHIVPVSASPDLAASVENMRASCSHCNRSRGDGRRDRRPTAPVRPSREW